VGRLYLDAHSVECNTNELSEVFQIYQKLPWASELIAVVRIYPKNRNAISWDEFVSKQSDKHNINNRIDQRYESDEDESTQETGSLISIYFLPPHTENFIIVRHW